MICNKSVQEPIKLPGVEYKFCVECTDTMFLEHSWPASFTKSKKKSMPDDFVEDMLFLLQNMSYEYVEISSKYSGRYEALQIDWKHKEPIVKQEEVRAEVPKTQKPKVTTVNESA